ncbi:MAG: enolase C-terminal domain-like protein [Planctomycetaceae bacterium]
MKISTLQAFEFPVQLRKPVRHASFHRYGNQTLIMRCELSDGSVGWGEAIPRDYVTGESFDLVWKQLASTDWSQLADRRLSDPERWVSVLRDFRPGDIEAPPDAQERGCIGHAVRCAAETAVLDAVCRSFRMNLSDLLRDLAEPLQLATSLPDVRYSGVVTSGTSALQQYRSAVKMKVFGFESVKVKVGTEGIDDEKLLTRLRRVLGQRVRLRLDANEAWHPDEVAERAAALMRFDCESIEQPVAHRYVDRLAEIRRVISLPIMLDESVCSVTDAERAIHSGSCDQFSIRISKCGGLLNCLELLALANRNGIGCQLGCMVGETGILSAAGRHLACSVAGLLNLEGSYDRFLVRDRLTEEDLTFSRGGFAPRIVGLGLGVHVRESAILKGAVRRLRNI